MRLSTILACCILAVNSAANPNYPGFKSTDIRLLARAIALIDYPVSQTQFRVLTGFQFSSPIGRYSEDNTGAARDVLLFPLATDASDGGYQLRLSLTSPTAGASDRSPQVEASAIIYTSSIGTFILDSDTFPFSLIPYLKALRRESGLSIREFVESPNWTININRALPLAVAKARQAANQPNKAPEPTTTAVTPPAAQEPRQP